MKVEMNQFGSSLCTRSSGRAAYSAISEMLSESEERLTFDFSHVDSITNSFADECFGHLAADLGIDALKKRTTFKNVERGSALLIRMAINRRIGALQMSAA